MPRARCECGETLAWSQYPNPIEWLIISDEKFDSFGPGKINRSAVYRSMAHALRCPRCRRLWISWNGFDEAPEELLPRTLVDEELMATREGE